MASEPSRVLDSVLLQLLNFIEAVEANDGIADSLLNVAWDYAVRDSMSWYRAK